MAKYKFPVSISDPVARITTYCADVFERLDAIGNRELKSESLKHMIKTLLQRAKPPALNIALEERLKV